MLEVLGLATLAWLALAAVELGLGGPAIDRPLMLAYLPGAALVLSAAFGSGVALVHGAHLLLAKRWPERAAITTSVLLGLSAVPSTYALSGALVEGEWVAQQAWADALRGGSFVLLELAWLALWAFYGASLALGTRRERALWWLVAILALAGASIVLQGPLLAYPVIARHAVFPAWLIALGMARQLAAAWPRAGRYAGLVGLALGALSCAFSVVDRDRLRYARSEAEASSSFAAIAETLVTTRPTRLGKLPFDRASGAACAEARQPSALPLAPEQRRNVIWLSIDTMRRDAIGKRFGDRAVAPHLEAFGKRSVFFERAVSPAAGTLFSMSSALSGHSVSQLLFMPKPPPNIFQRVRAELTEQRIVLPDWGMFRERPFKKLITQSAPVTFPGRKTDPLQPFIAALESAKERDQRGFFWLHLVDAHLPYTDHKQFGFGDSQPARYYSEIAFDDAIVGRALAHLEANGYFDDSLIAVFSDHGEALGEDGRYFGHGVSMRARFTDIPLYVRYPGVVARASQAAVALTSLPATVLHFLGRAIPSELSGCSLLEPEASLARCPVPVSTSYGLRSEFLDSVLRSPISSYEELEPRQALIASKQKHAPELAFTTASHRYLLNLATGAERLFDRAGDPNEAHNLVRRERALAARFRGIAERWSEDEAARIACRVAAR
jgi:arylsulfatase A-like enzyme